MTKEGQQFSIIFQIKGKHGLLQKFIDEKQWTQSDFARAINENPVSVGLWFNMKAVPGKKALPKVVALTGLSPFDLWPEIARSQTFLNISKRWQFQKEIDLKYLPFYEVPELEYNPDLNSFELREKIDEALKILNPKRREAIIDYFELNGPSKHSGQYFTKNQYRKNYARVIAGIKYLRRSRDRHVEGLRELARD